MWLYWVIAGILCCILLGGVVWVLRPARNSLALGSRDGTWLSWVIAATIARRYALRVSPGERKRYLKDICPHDVKPSGATSIDVGRMKYPEAWMHLRSGEVRSERIEVKQ